MVELTAPVGWLILWVGSRQVVSLLSTNKPCELWPCCAVKIMVSLWTLSLLLLVSRVSQGQSPSLFIPSLSHLLLRLLVFYYILVVSSICLHFHPLPFYQNSPTAFQVRCHRRRLNLALVFLCWLCYMHFYLHGASDAWVLAVIVCLSVCLSVTRRHCIERAKRRITQTTPRDSPGTVFFLPPRVGGGRPFRLKFAFKVTPPLLNTTISTNICS